MIALLVPGFLFCALGGFLFVRGGQESNGLWLFLGVLCVALGAACNSLATGDFGVTG